jgi:hypothetical protein
MTTVYRRLLAITALTTLMFGAGLARGQDSRSTKEHRVAQEKSKKHARAKKEHKKKKEKTTQPEDNYNLLGIYG